jgi:hypothetical protein
MPSVDQKEEDDAPALVCVGIGLFYSAAVNVGMFD